MAIALVFGVCDLISELLAHTLYIFAFAHFTGAVAALCLKTFLYGADDLLVFVKAYLHNYSAFEIKARRESASI